MERLRIARLLPEVYRSAGAEDARRPLGAVLAVMEALHAPVEAVFAHLGDYVTPHRAPPGFVGLLAVWLDLDRYLHVHGARRESGRPHYAAGEARLAALVAEAPELARGRGGRATLERFLRVATGLSGVSVEESPPDARGQPRPFHIRVTVPAVSGALRELVTRIVDEERPACVTYELVFAGAARDPSPEARHA